MFTSVLTFSEFISLAQDKAYFFRWTPKLSFWNVAYILAALGVPVFCI